MGLIVETIYIFLLETTRINQQIKYTVEKAIDPSEFRLLYMMSLIQIDQSLFVLYNNNNIKIFSNLTE